MICKWPKWEQIPPTIRISIKPRFMLNSNPIQHISCFLPSSLKSNISRLKKLSMIKEIKFKTYKNNLSPIFPLLKKTLIFMTMSMTLKNKTGSMCQIQSANNNKTKKTVNLITQQSQHSHFTWKQTLCKSQLKTEDSRTKNFNKLCFTKNPKNKLSNQSSLTLFKTFSQYLELLGDQYCWLFYYLQLKG